MEHIKQLLYFNFCIPIYIWTVQGPLDVTIHVPDY